MDYWEWDPRSELKHSTNGFPGNDPEMIKFENALISPALHAGINLVALRVLVPGMVTTLDWKTPAIIGAGAEVVGGYAFDNFLKAKLM